MHHRDGGPDPKSSRSAQLVFHRPTGACHTSHNHPSQPELFVGDRVARLEHSAEATDLLRYELNVAFHCACKKLAMSGKVLP